MARRFLLAAIVVAMSACGGSEPGREYLRAEAAYREAWRVAPTTSYQGEAWDIALDLLKAVPKRKRRDHARAQALVADIEQARATAGSDRGVAEAGELLQLASAAFAAQRGSEPEAPPPEPARPAKRAPPARPAAARQAPSPSSTSASPAKRPVSASVTIYTRATCGFCRSAKRWMAESGVSYQERALDNNPSVARELDERLKRAGRSGNVGVPVIDWNGEIIVGFNRGRLESLAARDRR